MLWKSGNRGNGASIGSTRLNPTCFLDLDREFRLPVDAMDLIEQLWKQTY